MIFSRRENLEGKLVGEKGGVFGWPRRRPERETDTERERHNGRLGLAGKVSTFIIGRIDVFLINFIIRTGKSSYIGKTHTNSNAIFKFYLVIFYINFIIIIIILYILLFKTILFIMFF